MTKFDFEFFETGHGPAMLMLPGSYATPAAWRGICGSLKNDYRILSTSLPGYGSTPEIRRDGHPDVGQMIEFVGQVFDAVGEPVHVVGHSWGAQLALAAVLRGRISPLSLVCFEANPLFARPSGRAFSWEPEINAMIRAFAARLESGDPEAAGIIIDFYSHAGAFQEMPEAVRKFCQQTARTNILDWYSAATFTPDMEEFENLELAVTLVRGSDTAKPMLELTESLAAHIPKAQDKVVNGADHFLISTHPEICAELIEAHIARTRETGLPA